MSASAGRIAAQLAAADTPPKEVKAVGKARSDQLQSREAGITAAGSVHWELQAPLNEDNTAIAGLARSFRARILSRVARQPGLP